MEKVSELLTLKIENLRLKLQQLQTLANQIQSEQLQLIEQARAEVGAPSGYIFNTDTRLFQTVEKPAPFKAPFKREQKRLKNVS